MFKIPTKNEIKSILKNKDLQNTSLNKSWAVIAGPLSLLFIPFYLTQELQGYYYSFISISALTLLADLGFSHILLQFAAHEFAYLKHKNKEFAYENPLDEIHLIKLASLFRFSILWILRMILFIFPIIFIAGFLLFKSNHDDINWLIPWIIFCFGSMCSFLNNSILYFFEGCDLVSRIQRIRFYNAVTFTLIVLGSLALGLNLYSIALGSLISSLLTSLLIITYFSSAIHQLILLSGQKIYKWKNEILKLFWKYVISYSSAYFTLQIYTPLAFIYHGAVEAGRIGFSLAVWLAIISISDIWIVSIRPKINKLVANQNWVALDKLVLKRFIAGELTLIGFGLIFFIMYFLLNKFINIEDRFVSIMNLIILLIIWFFIFLISTLTNYLRAHKDDPFYFISLLSAFFIIITTYCCVKYLSSDFIFAGWISSILIFLPWQLIIFKNHRIKLHK